MARYTGPKCKLCRREGTKLFLKGDRCYSSRCALERRNYKPGQHGQSRMRGRSRMSSYGEQLREKQKARRIYGILEKQFRNYYIKAAKKVGVTGTNLLQSLEMRLDNVVYRLGLAPNRNTARQLVKHSHFTLNGKRADIPSINVKPGDIVGIKEKSKNIVIIKDALENRDTSKMEEWLEFNEEKAEGTLLSIPTREQIPININELLIVEYYSK